jgi:methyltransferase (TIGR00027 family)
MAAAYVLSDVTLAMRPSTLPCIATVTDTAATIARVREEEASKPSRERLFEDPFAHLFRGGDAAAEVLERFASAPFFRESVRVRTRFIDDGVRDAVASGIRQVLILGAGFDCRALRLPEIAAQSVAVFEVDFAEQLRTKREILAHAGIVVPERVHAVSCDFMAPEFAARLSRDLQASGFDAGAATCMLWEGVMSYLNDAGIDATLRWLARAGSPGSRLIFNYTTFRLTAAGLLERARAAGFATLFDYGCDELYRRYLQSEPPPYGEFYRLGEAHV